ncbi:MAG TPA: VWA domain-containing protein [Blastocatellia bacterium]
MRHSLLICGLVLAVSHLVVAQTIQQSSQSQSTEQQSDDTIRLETSVVNTYVSVRDPRGNFIRGLTKDDFVVLEDGKEQPVTYFSNETDEPLRVAVLIDRSRSVHDVLSRAEDVVRDFISSVLRPGKDSACVIGFDSGVYLLQDFTDNADVLAGAVDELTSAGGTSMFDAIYKTSRDKLAAAGEERRVMILITDGEDSTSHASIDQAIEMAINNNVAIYVIRLPSEHSLNVRDQQAKPVLTRLTSATGGRQFLLEEGERQLSGFFDQLRSELRAQYSIGYQFQAAPSETRFHKITIKLIEPGLKAFARSGYYSRSQ